MTLKTRLLLIDLVSNEFIKRTSRCRSTFHLCRTVRCKPFENVQLIFIGYLPTWLPILKKYTCICTSIYKKQQKQCEFKALQRWSFQFNCMHSIVPSSDDPPEMAALEATEERMMVVWGAYLKVKFASISLLAPGWSKLSREASDFEIDVNYVSIDLSSFLFKICWISLTLAPKILGSCELRTEHLPKVGFYTVARNVWARNEKEAT